MTQLQEKQEQRLLASAEARKRAMSKAVLFDDVLFQNPQGREVMQEIKDQFDQEVLCMEGAHETIIRAAQRDVVRWIEEVITRGQGNDVEG